MTTRMALSYLWLLQPHWTEEVDIPIWSEQPFRARHSRSDSRHFRPTASMPGDDAEGIRPTDRICGVVAHGTARAVSPQPDFNLTPPGLREASNGTHESLPRFDSWPVPPIKALRIRLRSSRRRPSTHSMPPNCWSKTMRTTERHHAPPTPLTLVEAVEKYRGPARSADGSNLHHDRAANLEPYAGHAKAKSPSTPRANIVHVTIRTRRKGGGASGCC